eukprot:2711251-Pleurochrysis_carterae.AAC.1
MPDATAVRTKPHVSTRVIKLVSLKAEHTGAMTVGMMTAGNPSMLCFRFSLLAVISWRLASCSASLRHCFSKAS